MELTLKKAGYDYYEPVEFVPFSCETMREHIVPDSCADIARIVETTGQVRVTSREVSGDGRFCAGGTVDVSVLYIPEKGEGPRSLRFQIPFQSYGDEHWDGKHEFLDIRGEVQNVDTRLLNPRKVLTRVNLILHPVGCRRTTLSLCTDVQEEESIQIMREQHQTRVIAAVREKEFSFLEELALSPGHGGAEEILSARVDLRGTDCKQIGSKLVVKGIAAATVLYRESGGGVAHTKQEYPFSQILDGSGLEEEWENESVFRILNAECTIGGDGGADNHHILTLNLLVNVRVTVWKTEQIHFIADLYSTACPVVCETEEITLRENDHRYTRRQNVREMMETGTSVKTVVDVEVETGVLRRGTEEGVVEIPVRARCLFLDENDALHSIRREFSVSCPVEQEGRAVTRGCAFCCGDVMTGILPDGIELRFPVEFELENVEEGRYLSVCGGEPAEETDVRQCPSVVLRKIGQDETLWSVAKQYRTTCASILQVNEIEDERKIPLDRLLLIPRCR